MRSWLKQILFQFLSKWQQWLRVESQIGREIVPNCCSSDCEVPSAKCSSCPSDSRPPDAADRRCRRLAIRRRDVKRLSLNGCYDTVRRLIPTSPVLPPPPHPPRASRWTVWNGLHTSFRLTPGFVRHCPCPSVSNTSLSCYAFAAFLSTLLYHTADSIGSGPTLQRTSLCVWNININARRNKK